MYNDYYLQQIDSKLSFTNDLLSDVITNQNTIISNQIIINDKIDFSQNEFFIFSFWVIALLFAIILYHFYHESFNHHK